MQAAAVVPVGAFDEVVRSACSSQIVLTADACGGYIRRMFRKRNRSTSSRRSRVAQAARVLASLAVLSVAVCATGCTAVAPYERGKLAHPTMSAGGLSTMGEEHLHAISEGATGGSGGTGSGCGCN